MRDSREEVQVFRLKVVQHVQGESGEIHDYQISEGSTKSNADGCERSRPSNGADEAQSIDQDSYIEFQG